MSNDRLPKRACFKKAVHQLFNRGDPIHDEDTIQLYESDSEDDGNIVDENFVDNFGDFDQLLEDDYLNDIHIHPIDLNSSDDSDESDSEVVQEEYISPSGSRWTVAQQTNNQGRAPVRNIINFQSGPKRGINPEGEKEAVLMFLDKVLEDCLLYSNLQGHRITTLYNRHNPDAPKKWHPIIRSELDPFIGILIILGELLI